jgi:hypothetical protein
MQGDLFSQSSLPGHPEHKESHDDMGIRRPVTWWREQVLSGRIPMTDAPAAVQSWLRHDIFLGAEEILAIPYKPDRNAALARIPALVRPYVEAEVLRLWVLSKPADVPVQRGQSAER